MLGGPSSTLPGTLLPEGFRDRLPPEAEANARLLRIVLDTAAAHGYRRVQPPLAEYEAGLARWLGGAQARGLLRASDPATGEALVLRPDITAQIARLAATRLAGDARPLRLSYGGPVLRARGSELSPARERTQAGAELIGRDSVAALVELIGIAAEALTAAGVEGLSVDLTLPELVASLAAGPWPVPDWQDVADALDGKDWGALEAAGRRPYRALLAATGELGPALAQLRALGLPPAFGALFDSVEALAAALPGLRLTLDPTERHGFEYQSWIGFSLFGAAGGQAFATELGRGGAYRVRGPDGRHEPAAGFSLYIDPLAEAGLGQAPERRLFLPTDTPAELAARLRAEGWQTVRALDPGDAPHALGCAFRLQGTGVVEIG
jgi:ATP phosphoribosyltransferase regulatory subunit